MDLEDKAGIVIKTPAELGCECQPGGIDALGFKGRKALFEGGDGRIQAKAEIAGEIAQHSGGAGAIRLQGQIGGKCFRRLVMAAGTAGKGGLFQKSVCDFAGRASADGGNSGNRQKILDDRMGSLRISPFQRRQETEADVAAVIVGGGGSGHAGDRGGQTVGLAKEITQPAAPDGRQVKPFQHGGKQGLVANSDDDVRQAEFLQGLDGKRKQVRIRFGRVRTAEAFRTKLRDFAQAVRALAEHRAVVAIGGRKLDGVLRQMMTANRNGEVGAQAQIKPVGTAGQIEPAPDVLAGEIQKDVRRLQYRRAELVMALGLEEAKNRLDLLRSQSGHLCRPTHDQPSF